MDDIQGLKACWRFLIQFIVCSIFLALHQDNIALQFMPIVLLSMIWMVNLYNFMDGSDGIAGGMALFGFSAYAIAAHLSGGIYLAIMCATIASANLAFLLLNFHPAKIFMGDVGSIPLGFLAAALGILGWQQMLWPIWFPILVFSPFIMDATVTLIKRTSRGEKVWLPHKTHYYQRLVQMGWGHRKTAVAEYAVMLASSVTAVLLINQNLIMVSIILTLWVLLYAGLMWIIDRRW